MQLTSILPSSRVHTRLIDRIAYAIMCDLKSLFDPDSMLNPGVIINDDPQAHVARLKSLSLVAPEIDKCIECGYCELKCPSPPDPFPAPTDRRPARDRSFVPSPVTAACFILN